MASAGLLCKSSSYIGVGTTAEPGTERIILVSDNAPASVTVLVGKICIG